MTGTSKSSAISSSPLDFRKCHHTTTLISVTTARPDCTEIQSFFGLHASALYHGILESHEFDLYRCVMKLGLLHYVGNFEHKQLEPSIRS